MSMEYIKLKRVYVTQGQNFEIISSLSTNSQNIAHIIEYKGTSGKTAGFQINSEYVNIEKLTENYNRIFERCDAIAERLSGWENVIDKLSEDGFEIIEHK